MNSNTDINNQYLMIKKSINSVIDACKDLYEKLKQKLSMENKFEFLNIIKSNLNKISNVLIKHASIFKEEFKSYSKIEKYIIYIVGQNCEDENFGHLNCVEFLLTSFKSLFDKKIEYLTGNINHQEYIKQLKLNSKQLYEFRMFFNENIFQKDNQFDDEIKQLNNKLCEDFHEKFH